MMYVWNVLISSAVAAMILAGKSGVKHLCRQYLREKGWAH